MDAKSDRQQLGAIDLTGGAFYYNEDAELAFTFIFPVDIETKTDSFALFGVLGGAMYAQYRLAKAADCLPMPDGVTPAEGASAFVNPLTALGMVETMRMEGHKGLVHTAAASNLGQMLVKICKADGVPLVNLVRRPTHVTHLREIGAQYVVDSSAPTFAPS